MPKEGEVAETNQLKSKEEGEVNKSKEGEVTWKNKEGEVIGN